MTVKEPVDTELESIEGHWFHVQPLLSEIADEADYDRRMAFMERLLERATDIETDPRAKLASRIADLIEAYDEAHRPLPEPGGRETLRYLMAEHGVSQSEVPEVGTQSVLSEVLSGKRGLNWRQIQALADRFEVATDAFRDNGAE